jgi:predicted phosphodiesterase
LEIYSFYTAPILDSTGKLDFDIVVVSDLHGSGASMTKTLDLIHTFVPNLKFIVSCGDNVSDSRIVSHWRTFWGQMKSISPFIPFETAPGNHEAHINSLAQSWIQAFPCCYPDINIGFHFSFIYQNTAFFFIDPYNKGNQSLYSKDQQKTWLIQKLELLPESISFRFLIMHNSIYTTGESGCDPDLELTFLDIIDKYKINIVFSGHSHIFEAFHRSDLNIPNGTTFITTGGGGGRLDYSLFRKIAQTPYLWESNLHIAKIHPFMNGDRKSRYRNDEIVLNYQEIGKITHEIIHVSVKNNKIIIRAYEWNHHLLYERIINSSQ